MTKAKSTRQNPRLIDLTGQRFGRLTVIERAENDGRQPQWTCTCDCGAETVTRGGSLRSGNTKSCGCLSRELSRVRIAEMAEIHTTHGQCGHPLYGTWRAMNQRCTDPNHPGWKHYGGRDIGVCPEWRHDFATFAAYVGDRPEGKTLDRIDNDRGYEPGNVRWATAKEQQNNKRPRG